MILNNKPDLFRIRSGFFDSKALSSFQKAALLESGAGDWSKNQGLKAVIHIGQGGML